jgi:hypothetical protein
VYKLFSEAIQIFLFPALIGVGILLVSFGNTNWILYFLIGSISILGALTIDKVNLFHKISWATGSLFLILFSTLSGRILGMILAPISALSLGFLRIRRSSYLWWAFLVWVIFASIFIFSKVFYLQGAMLFFGALSLIFITASILFPQPYDKDIKVSEKIWVNIFVLSLLIMELIVVLWFLPYGYFSLAAIVSIWYFTILSLQKSYIYGNLSKSKVASELIISSCLTLFIILSSGIKPR